MDGQYKDGDRGGGGVWKQGIKERNEDIPGLDNVL
jgi:hypothetical protein